MHPFTTPWKHQKTLRFSVFREYQKRSVAWNGLKSIVIPDLIRTWSGLTKVLFKYPSFRFISVKIVMFVWFPESFRNWNFYISLQTVCKSAAWPILNDNYYHFKQNLLHVIYVSSWFEFFRIFYNFSYEDWNDFITDVKVSSIFSIRDNYFECLTKSIVFTLEFLHCNHHQFSLQIVCEFKRINFSRFSDDFRGDKK